MVKINFAAVVPLMVAGILVVGFIKDVDILDCFLKGGKSGLSLCLTILPTLVLMLTAVGILEESGAMQFICNIIPTHLIGIPNELTPIIISRPISGSLAMASFTQLLENVSPDSFIGNCASVMMGSTETTLYTLALYFGVVQIKSYRHALPSALIADFAGFIGSVVAVRMLM